MAFHVACPITCRRICYCALGFPSKLHSEKGRSDFLEEIFRVEEFLTDPWSIRAGGRTTVQISVPRITAAAGSVVADGGDVDEVFSAQNKRATLQKRAVAASLAAEDYARRFEIGNLADVSGKAVLDLIGEDCSSALIKVMCRICLSGEFEGSDGATRMLACRICSKKYHRNCLRRWAEYRDLFHWSSWACPMCRICETCRRSGDPNKFMFCKRCDCAYHCYCQQPPHKNVTPGPFLCSKHTRCHSCGSTVSGNGFSTRWFLGYTCCDACGRLFVKGNYCPVCLKVYRDSESTPMVCCDACQRWVHCQCDGISDEKYLQFQADRNLYYKCAACRGDCYQVRDLDDAVQELWRRRDEADRDQIASLRAAAGLPSQEDIFSIPPFSDDEENGSVIVKSTYGRSLKLSVKGYVEKTPKSNKEYGKKSSKSMSLKKKYAKKKGYQLSLMSKTEEQHQSFERRHEGQSLGSGLGDVRTNDMRSYRSEGPEEFSPLTTKNLSNNREKYSINEPGNATYSFIQEAVVHKSDRNSKLLQIKSRKPQGLHVGEGAGEHASKTETVKGTKLVIHLAASNRNLTNSPRSEAPSCHKEPNLAHSNGNEYNSQQKANDGMLGLDNGKGVILDDANLLRSSKQRGRGSSLIKLGNVKLNFSEFNSPNNIGDNAEQLESTALDDRVVSARNCEGTTAVEPNTHDEIALGKQLKSTSIILHGESHDGTLSPSGSGSSSKDPKPLLKLKFKNPYLVNQSSWVPQSEEEKSSVKGQRSKRRRPSHVVEKAPVTEDKKDGQLHQEDPIDEVMDANWILKKLGKDAIGKRVEVHQLSDNSWHKGVVTDMIRGTSSLAVHLDNGTSKILELGKQGVRLIPQKQKRTKM